MHNVTCIVQVQWRPTFVQCWKLKLPKSNHHGTNILVVKGTVHTRLKEIRAIATVITLASFDVGRLKKSLKGEEKDEEI